MCVEEDIDVALDGVFVSLHTDVVSVLMCSRRGLLLCGGLWCTYTPGALSVARAHAPHCDAQRVTLDCVLLPPLQTAHSHHTHKICTVCTCVQNIRRHLFQLGYITFVVAACFRLPLYNVCSSHGIV